MRAGFCGMSFPGGNNNEKWRQLLNQSQITDDLKECLAGCRVKKIIVSQAEKAWEIYFHCRIKPDESAGEYLHKIWTSHFGTAYKPVFYFDEMNGLDDLESVFRQKWPEILENLAESMPSCRGWLRDAAYAVDKNHLQVSVVQEIAWSYLMTQWAKDRLERMLQEEYGLKSTVSIVLQEEESGGNDHNGDLTCRERAEDEYTDLLAEKIENLKRLKKLAGDGKKARVVLGKKISGDAVSIKEIKEEERSVTVRGTVFDLEIRPLKSGRALVTFAISDRTDSIGCKIITGADAARSFAANLAEECCYLIRGAVQTDRFTQELTMMPEDIAEAVVDARGDLCPEKRVELHLHTKMSALDGVGDVRRIIERAGLWGHEAVAITDHGVVQAFPEAYEASLKHQVRVIYGMEGYLFDDSSISPSGAKVPTYHVVILAQNQEGLRNLYELVTLSHLKYFYRRPRVPKSELVRLRKGLLVGTACEAGELIRYYLQGADDTKLEEIATFYDYLEIQPRQNNYFLLDNGTLHSEDDLLAMNKKIYELGKRLNKLVVATGDVHFIDPEDEVYRRILMTGKGFEEADNQAPLYFKTTGEMLEEFAYLGPEAAFEVVVTNTRELAAGIEPVKPIPDDFYPPEIPGAEDEIAGLTMTRAYELYGNPLPGIVENRINKELNSIITNGFAVLYLIAHKLVKKSNEDGYLVGSRGSVGSSLVATLCGITEVNPLPPHHRCPHCRHSIFIEDNSVGCGADLPGQECPECGTVMDKDGHNIPFEVFLGFEGDKVPDIDLNFSGEYQQRAHKYAEELFGKDNVFRAGTIATIATKTAFGFVKNYFEEKNEVVRTAEMNRLINGCTGVKRTTGQHPGGVMVLPKGLDVHLFTPLQHPADQVSSATVTTHFDYHSISSRLVKLDLLGHDDPTVLKMLEDLTGVDCRSIPLDESAVMSLFCSTEALQVDPSELGATVGTLGVPEFGTKFVRQMLEDTKPRTFADLVRISGFSHGTDVWLHNAQDLIRSQTAKVAEVIAARDDIMNYLIEQGIDPRRAFKIMEDVRRGKGVHPDDVIVMQDNNVPDWYIESCQKIKYMFPKAHAVAYVMMAFRIAYFKVYYPAAFYASHFTVRADEFDASIVVGGIPSIRNKMEEIIKKGKEVTQKEEKLYTILELALEMYLRGISLKKVDLALSDSVSFLIVDEGRALLPPFIALQGLGKTAAVGITMARAEKPFLSRDDLRIRSKVTKTVLEVLDSHGSLAGLPENDQMSLFGQLKK